MTTAIQRKRERKISRPYAPQKFYNSQEPEHRSSPFRVSIRRAETDWEEFERVMQIMIETCRDPEYRARLKRFQKKVYK